MNEIILNPTDHPAGTEFIHAKNNQMVSDVVLRWSEGGRLQIRSEGVRFWFFPAGVKALEILPPSPTPSTSVDFAELVAACRALDAELLDEYDSEAVNAALHRIRAIVGRGVKMPQEGGTDAQ
jgi:hypothetical protein